MLLSSYFSKVSVGKEIPSMEAPNSSSSVDEQFLVNGDWETMKFGGSIDRLPSLSHFGSESLSEIMNSFGLPENAHGGNDVCARILPSSIEQGREINFKGKKRKKFEECSGLQADSTLTSTHDIRADKPNDIPTENTKNSVEKDEKKQKNEICSSSKENNNAPKEDFIHLRAKRGQATNSHSLAERVRREKISERMKLLQDLVPGCNKITGKAVMLDEIINYVQSLQKQVEFLSMKLATVNPEINIDIDQILAKENLHSRYDNLLSLGHFQHLGIHNSQLQPRIALPNLYNSSTDFLRIASSNHQLSALSQIPPNAWNNEFQNTMQMGLLQNMPQEGNDINGSMKLEL